MNRHPHEHGSEAFAPQAAGPKPHLMTLIILSAVNPLSLNLFVPSIPSIADHFDAPYATIQLGLSLYLIVTAALQLVIGPLSDFYGRRPVVLAGMVIFILGTLMCIFATSPALFLAGRVIQATCATGMVLSRAIVRDVYPREKSASMIGYMVMGMAIAPMIAPAIGGLIDQVAGWEMTFVFMGACGAFALVATIFNLPETNRFRGTPLSQQLASYRELARIRLFWLYGALAGFSSALFFGLLGGGPAVATAYYGLGPAAYGLYFGATALGYSIGNFISGRYSESVGLEPMMLRGVLISTLAPIITILLIVSGFDNPVSFFIPLSLVGFGNGMTLPNAMAAAISLKPEAAGASSGLLGAVQIGVGAAASIVAGVIAGGAGLPIPLSLFLVACGIVAILLSLVSGRMSRRI